MARIADRLPGNAPGDLYVDASCIACDTCRRTAPGVFGGGEDDTSFVAHQPASESAWSRALMALIACPVAAIGTVEKHAGGVRRAARGFPEPVPGVEGVLACGYTAEASFGAASWLVLRAAGNVLVDSPRFAAPLLERIRALGGARWMFLTHRDDVADHERWAEALRCERLMHAADAGWGAAVERLVEGEAPVTLDGDLTIVPVPGHTRGSAALLYGRSFFTGDHLWGTAEGALDAGRSVCWWSWTEQTRSMERLLPYAFTNVFPGHGRPWSTATPELARAELARLIARMRVA